ncbi:MAG TPA: bifunctional phosphoribosylaminoimidazolecarboxamide formyltransferase/IMP cyclohydrolase [Aquifex aeolicus]|nr:bifunctional phosphoribosylaminoimidazolecarboxamide formyltransferase/IMP cyclohydrolase [Aquifex aeolicus]
MRALISVYRKEGVEEVARVLQKLGYEILSTGGTAEYLRNHGIEIKDVSTITGFPEILGGRVKTLHPAIYGGILFRDWVERDAVEIKELGIEPVDVVVINLYPFEEMMKEGIEERELMEFVDIGGPSLIRAAAKNYLRVVPLVDPEDYRWVMEKMERDTLSLRDRAYLAWKAFSHTAYYDSVISSFLKKSFGIEEYPKELSIPMKLSLELRYGENPHQRGGLYINPLEGLGIATAEVLQGKKMSFNNYLDADSCVRLLSEFTEAPACVIVKHNNPCGVALGESLQEAFVKALDTDPDSAFGGVVAFNDTVGVELAEKLTSRFFELLIAPDYTEEALSVFSKKKNLRVLRFFGMSASFDLKKVSGGFLLQDEDLSLHETLEVVTRRKPREEEMEDLLFAWKVCKYVKSNAVVIAKGRKTLAIGSGQVSRVDSLRCAVEKARRRGIDLSGAVLASEAFFPFRDSIDLAHEVGIRAIIHPGGSVRDSEVFCAADEHGIAMVITRMRHFRH